MADALPTSSETGRPKRMVQHIIAVYPAVSFDYRFESSARAERVIYLERGALETRDLEPQETRSFRAVVSPGFRPTRGGFFTAPDTIALTAEAHILVDGGVAGDSIICRSLASSDELTVTLKVFRQDDAGGIALILQEEIRDAEEHSFSLP